jgi:ketosteroid isomerase-like protein
MTTPVGVPGPRELLERAHKLFLSQETLEFPALFAADGVHELPFAPPGVPKTLTGPDAIRDYLSAASGGAPMTLTEYRNEVIRDTADGGIVVEYDACGQVTGTDRTYAMRHVLFVEARDGKISVWRDYWSPLDAVKVFGRLPESWLSAGD